MPQLFIFLDRSALQNHEPNQDARHIWQNDVHFDGHRELQRQKRVENRLCETYFDGCNIFAIKGSQYNTNDNIYVLHR